MEKVASLIHRNQRFLLTTHINPDGDGIGSQMALHSYLLKCGKQSWVINCHPTPAKFQLVDPKGHIQVFDGQDLPDVDVILVLDTNDERMLGEMKEPLKSLSVPLIYVDHHVPEVENLSDHLVDESYGATGELVYSLLRELRADIDAEMAIALYVAIVTDTGSFRYKRTTPRSHQIAAELLQKGVNPEFVYQKVFAQDSLAKTRLLGHVLETVQTRCDGRLVYIEISKALREKYGATVEDTESFVDQLTLIHNLAIGALFREEDDGRIKVSLRGMGEIPVVGIAKGLGGGGHRHAAGARVTMPLRDAVEQVCQAAELLLQSNPPHAVSR